jgi:hypothetical protein
MPKGGAGGIVFISDLDENSQRVSTLGRILISESYPLVKNHSPINVTAASGGSGFDSVEVGKVILHSESGNNIMWWGGIENDAPYSGRGMPLWGGQKTPPLPITNFNAIRIVAATSGQLVYAIGFLNGGNAVLTNVVPQPPPQAPPDTTLPYVVSHSPVSGFSGLSFNRDLTVTFSEEIKESSVVSGVFTLSPSHNMVVYRDPIDAKSIVLEPQQNYSGSTTYKAVLKSVSGVQDLAHNAFSGNFWFPFTTTLAPPPPDTTPPTVASTNPSNGATNVVNTTNVLVTFSEQMLSGTINSTNLYLSKSIGGAKNPSFTSVSLSANDKKTATLNPTGTLDDGTTYYIQVLTGVQDLAGNHMTSNDISRAFSTTPVVTNPESPPPPTLLYNVTGSSQGDMHEGNDTRMGLQVTSTASGLYGKAPKQVTVRLRRDGDPGGSVFVRFRRGSTDAIVKTYGSIVASTLSEDDFLDYTFTDLNFTTTMLVGDKILCEYTDTDSGSSDKIEVRRANSNADGGAEYCKLEDNGSYALESDKDIAFTIYGN